MRTAKYIIAIILMVVVVASVILVFSANYFAWRKNGGGNYDRAQKIKIISLIVMLSSVAALIVIMAI